MHKRFITSLLVSAAMLAACGGGGSSAPAPAPPGPIVTPGPTATPAPAGNLPLSETVGGGQGWVDPATHHTLYYLDVDTATGGTCTAGCLGVWPVFVPTAGAVGAGNMTVITRSDGTGSQWAYQGHPLYHYAGDSAADQTNGEGIPDFGGHWHVSRTVAATAPPGGQTPPPCGNIYC
jgi:predicted lipoprotein with Yx(FWY)xxD motif